MDVLMTLNSQEIQSFLNQDLHALLRPTGILNILSPQKIYVCSSQSPISNEPSGVLGELKGYQTFELNKHVNLNHTNIDEVRNHRKDFVQTCLKHYSQEEIQVRMSNDICWGLFVDQCKVYESPVSFSEFHSSMGVPLNAAPLNMKYVHRNTKEHHGLSMTLEEFLA